MWMTLVDIGLGGSYLYLPPFKNNNPIDVDQYRVIWEVANGVSADEILQIEICVINGAAGGCLNKILESEGNVLDSNTSISSVLTAYKNFCQFSRASSCLLSASKC